MWPWSISMPKRSMRRGLAPKSSTSAMLLALAADVARRDDVTAAIEATVAAFGGLDILVNNAGTCPLTPFEQIDESEWIVLAVNLKGAFLCCQAALPYLRRSGRGRIISISSVSGQMGGLLVGAHYAASKAALVGMSKSLAKLLAADGGQPLSAASLRQRPTPISRLPGQTSSVSRCERRFRSAALPDRMRWRLLSSNTN